MKHQYMSFVSGFLICIFVLCTFPGYADDTISSNTTNATAGNQTAELSGVEYPANGTEVAAGLDYGISAQGYADAGRISTGFSGSSIEASGDNQSPAAVMTFSDKSSVSGFIKNFMKSFTYESGVDL